MKRCIYVFRRNEGQYRETDRVTRFKLVKSGKHWLRAATSHFGLFKIISGRVDASSVSVHQVEEEVPLITSDRLLKGVAATGALLGGGVATYVVQADEATSPSAVEHTVSPTTDVLAASDSAVLGHSGAITESAVRGDVVSQSASATDSVSNSVDSVSLSLSASHQLLRQYQRAFRLSLNLCQYISFNKCFGFAESFGIYFSFNE